MSQTFPQVVYRLCLLIIIRWSITKSHHDVCIPLLASPLIMTHKLLAFPSSVLQKSSIYLNAPSLEELPLSLPICPEESTPVDSCTPVTQVLPPCLSYSKRCSCHTTCRILGPPFTLYPELLIPEISIVPITLHHLLLSPVHCFFR